MSKQLMKYEQYDEFDYDHVVTEDDEPVDNIFSEKEQRLLTESLMSSWDPKRKFVAFSNVGIFYDPKCPPVVPDMFLSLDVQVHHNLLEKKHRSYFLPVFGKPPEVVVEIVSNTKGGENTTKKEIYEHIGVLYYIVYDPDHHIQKEPLRIYKLKSNKYMLQLHRQLEDVGLGVILWEGEYEGAYGIWLRWCDHNNHMILTGKEKAEAEKMRAEVERIRAENEKKRAEEEKIRAEAERIRAENEKKRAEEEKIRAEAERIRAENEKKRAEEEKIRAEQAEEAAKKERLRAEQEKQRADLLEAKLRALGILE